VTSLALRRALGISALVTLSGMAILLHGSASAGLRDTSFISGWLLLALLLVLTLFGLRKKLPFLPLGSASSWLQLHVYLGWGSVVVFALHAGLGVPSGTLEVALAALYVVVVGSGVAGLLATRLFPARLTTRGPLVLFERIPVQREALREEIEQLVQEAATGADAGSEVVDSLYREQLQPFFRAPRHLWLHLIESDRPLQQILEEISALRRYVSEREQAVLDAVAERVRRKSDLDYQYSLQAVLKAWLFVHVPLSYSLLVVAVLHAALAHMGSGRAG
jgi:hypothetical protein